MKKQLEGFRDIHRAFADIMSEETQEKKVELISREFRQLTGAREIAVFFLNPVTERFEYRASAGKGARKYAGGFLEAEIGEIRPFIGMELKGVKSQAVAVRTKNKRYDFSDKYIMVLPVSVCSMICGVILSEHEDECSIESSDTRELMGAFLNVLSPVFQHHVEALRMKEKAKSLELLYEIGSKLSSIRDENQLLEAIMELIEKNLHVNRCSLMIIDKDRKHLKIKKAFGLYDIDIKKVKVPLGEGIAGYVALGTRPLLIRDIAAEKHLISQVPQKEKFRTKSLLSVPLVAQGEVIGVINVNNRKDGLPFSESDKDLLCKIGSEIAAVLQRSYMALQMKKAKELDRDIKRFMV